MRIALGDNRGPLRISNGYDYSAAAAGRFYAARIHGVKLPYIAAVITLLLDAGG
ncbi:MAG: hypothetical protein ABFD91_03505 [Anaerohalosphaeraceae bacterium]